MTSSQTEYRGSQRGVKDNSQVYSLSNRQMTGTVTEMGKPTQEALGDGGRRDLEFNLGHLKFELPI